MPTVTVTKKGTGLRVINHCDLEMYLDKGYKLVDDPSPTPEAPTVSDDENVSDEIEVPTKTEVRKMTEGELADTVENFELDIPLGELETLTAKREAVYEALEEMGLYDD